jgi:hypothetical protein
VYQSAILAMSQGPRVSDLPERKIRSDKLI